MLRTMDVPEQIHQGKHRIVTVVVTMSKMAEKKAITKNCEEWEKKLEIESTQRTSF